MEDGGMIGKMTIFLKTWIEYKMEKIPTPGS